MDLSNLQSVLMKNPDKAMKLFDMISNIAADQPQSQIAKDWDQIIQTVGVDDILNAYANQEALSKGKTGYANQEASSEEKAGYSGWKRYFKQMYGDYAIPTGFAVNKVILPVAGGLAEATGNSLGAYNSILGTALGAMANNIQKNSDYDTTGYNDAARMRFLTKAAEKVGGGAVAKIAGDFVGNTARSVGAELEARNDKAREAALMINEHPVGDFYRDTMQLRKNAQNINKSIK